VLSWFRLIAPGPFTTSAPMLVRGCQMQKTAPVGSWIVDILPTSITSNGSASRFAPSSAARPAAASASSTVTYDAQAGCRSLVSYIAAAERPPSRAMT
jgi:hypothetical protein